MIAAALTEHVCISALLQADPGLVQGDEDATATFYAEVLEIARDEVPTSDFPELAPEDLAQEVMLEILPAARGWQNGSVRVS